MVGKDGTGCRGDFATCTRDVTILPLGLDIHRPEQEGGQVAAVRLDVITLRPHTIRLCFAGFCGGRFLGARRSCVLMARRCSVFMAWRSSVLSARRSSLLAARLARRPPSLCAIAARLTAATAAAALTVCMTGRAFARRGSSNRLAHPR